MKTGKPYVMFGDGQLASCKPISEGDLASFMADCVTDPVKANQVLPIGGVRQASHDSTHARAHELHCHVFKASSDVSALCKGCFGMHPVVHKY